MKKNNYLNIMFIFFMIVLGTSLFLFENTNFNLLNTSQKVDYQYTGSTQKIDVLQYYASTGEYYGGATLSLSENLEISQASVTLEDGTIHNHQVVKKDELTYVLDVIRIKESIKPTTLTLYNAEGELVDAISLHKSLGELYSFTDGNQTYRHIYVNEAGIFLGEYVIDELGEDFEQKITLEFVHRDETKSEGYHLLAKKQLTLGKFISGEDMGFLPFLETADYDATSELYVIVSWSDTNIVEIPLTKGVN